MGHGYPIELRERIVSCHVDEGYSISEAARRFHVSRQTASIYVNKWLSDESLEPGIARRSDRKLCDDAIAWIKKSIEENPFVTSYELAAAYNRAFKHNQVHRSTILRAMKELGFTFKKRRR
jgi:transposase